MQSRYAWTGIVRLTMVGVGVTGELDSSMQEWFVLFGRKQKLLISPNMMAVSHVGAVFVCRSCKAVELL